MKYLSIDIETYSSVDISKAGLYKYVQSFDFAILLFAYSVDGGPVQLVDLAQGEEIPPDIIAALGDINVTKYAYNASFEHRSITQPLFISGAVPWRKACTVDILRGFPQLVKLWG
jgi:DNA polymerase